MLSVTNTDGPAFNTRIQTHQCLSPDTSTSQPDITLEVSEATGTTPQSLTVDRLQALLQMQKTDPFCKKDPNVYQMGKHPSTKLNFSHM